MLLKLSVIRENDINDKTYCYTWTVLELISTNLFTQREIMRLRVIADIKHQNGWKLS